MIEYTVLDTKPDLMLQLMVDGEGLALNTALSVSLRVKKPSGATLDLAMDVDVAQSLVSAVWATDSLDEEGIYYADVLIVRTDGSRQHALRRIPIRVRPEYGILD